MLTKAFPFVLLALLQGCCNDDFIVPEEYIDVTYLIESRNKCTNAPIYGTGDARASSIQSSCVTGSTAYSQKFTFRAAPGGVVSIIMQTGPDGLFEYGTQQNATITIYDTDQLTELACVTARTPYQSLNLYRTGYTGGEYYYFSVSVPDEASRGTFSLCVTDGE